MPTKRLPLLEEKENKLKSLSRSGSRLKAFGIVRERVRASLGKVSI
jgi:predicted DNA-binding protein